MTPRITHVAFVPDVVTIDLPGLGALEVPGARHRTCATATFSDGTNKVLFTFYAEEMQFSERELLGLTEQQARQLAADRDLGCQPF